MRITNLFLDVKHIGVQCTSVHLTQKWVSGGTILWESLEESREVKIAKLARK